jgi:hypothetical protein
VIIDTRNILVSCLDLVDSFVFFFLAAFFHFHMYPNIVAFFKNLSRGQIMSSSDWRLCYTTIQETDFAPAVKIAIKLNTFDLAA